MSSIFSRVALGRAAVPVTADSLRAPLNKPAVNVRDSVQSNTLLGAIVVLALFGAVMITSASMAYATQVYGSPFYFGLRQLVFLGIGLLAALVLFQVPLMLWEKYGPHLIIVSLGMLVLVLLIGKEVNGARRWIDLGLITVQVSEMVKLFIIVYLAGYLVRRGYLVQNTFGGFVRPLVLICFASALLLLEPDFGAAVVIIATAMIMLYIAGVRFLQFVLLVGTLAALGALLIFTADYRRERFASFLDPFSDPFAGGFQLTQSLIAIGSGGLDGLGLGNSVQKLMYLPEAHTDFLFAVLCEELGFLGALSLVLIYGFIVWKSFSLARLADRLGFRFAGFIALGIGAWIGLQSFINMGVNMGMLPTKGITLPMMSYGGSSAVVFAVAFALLLRVEHELSLAQRQAMARIDSQDDESEEAT